VQVKNGRIRLGGYAGYKVGPWHQRGFGRLPGSGGEIASVVGDAAVDPAALLLLLRFIY